MEKASKYQRVNLAFRIDNEKEMIAYEILKKYQSENRISPTQVVTEMLLREQSNGETIENPDIVTAIVNGVTENIRAELQKLSIKNDSEGANPEMDTNEYYDQDDDLDNLDVFGF